MKTFLQFVYTTIGSYATEHYSFAVRNVFIKCLYIIASKSALICIKTPRNQYHFNNDYYLIIISLNNNNLIIILFDIQYHTLYKFLSEDKHVFYS